MTYFNKVKLLLKSDNCILLKELVKNPRLLPRKNGLYIVQIPDAVSINFLNTTTGPTIWKGKSTLVDKEFLFDKFNKGDKITAYIGSAHHKKVTV